MPPLHPSLERLTYGRNLDRCARTRRPTVHGGVALEKTIGVLGAVVPQSWACESLTSTTLLLAATGRPSRWRRYHQHLGTRRGCVSERPHAHVERGPSSDRFVSGDSASVINPCREAFAGTSTNRPWRPCASIWQRWTRRPCTHRDSSTLTLASSRALGPRCSHSAPRWRWCAHVSGRRGAHRQCRARSLADKILNVEQAVVSGQRREEFLTRAHCAPRVLHRTRELPSNWRRMGFGPRTFVRGGSERPCDAMVIHGDAPIIDKRGGRDHFEGPGPTTSVCRCWAGPHVPTTRRLGLVAHG